MAENEVVSKQDLDDKPGSRQEVLAKLLDDTITMKHSDGLLGTVQAYLTDRLTNMVTTREKYFNELARFRYNYITAGIYDIICNDVLTNTDDGGFVIEIEGDEELTQEANELIKALAIPDFLTSILPELLHYGSYPLRPSLEDGEGLIGLVDDFDPRDVIAVTDSSGLPIFFFVNYTTKDAGYIDYESRQKMEYLGPQEVSYLSLDQNFIKLPIPDKVTAQMKRKITEELGEDEPMAKLMGKSIKIRSSLSFLWGSLDKLKNILMLDKVNVYKTLANLLSPSVIGVPLPNNNDIKQMKSIVNDYDQIINSTNLFAADMSNLQFNLQDIVSVKVVPISGDRSVPQILDTGKSDNTIDPEKIRSELEVLLQSYGIPLELFLGSLSSKDNLRTNIRYAKKIKRIGKSLCKWLQYLLLLHFGFKYENLDLELSEIKVTLKSSINVDALENMETQDLLITSINGITGMLDSLKNEIENSNYTIDNDALLKVVSDTLADIGSPFHGVIKLKSEVPITQQTPTAPPEDGEENE